MQSWGSVAVAVKPGSWCRRLPGAQIKELDSVCVRIFMSFSPLGARSFIHSHAFPELPRSPESHLTCATLIQCPVNSVRSGDPWLLGLC